MLRRLGVYVGASWDYLLRLCWGLLAYVGPSWDYVGRSWLVSWAILALSWGHLGTMLGFVGSSWAYVGPAWDYVGRSWVLCWAILALCWPILGHVARCSNLTPCNSPQRAIFTVIYRVFCTFPTPILTPKSLQITLPPPPPPMAAADKRLSVSNAFRHLPRIPRPFLSFLGLPAHLGDPAVRKLQQLCQTLSLRPS